MLQRILVPLDGSPRAEQAIPVAASIAKNTGGTVLLLYVTTLSTPYGPYIGQTISFTEEIRELDVANANSYLEQIAHSDQLDGVKTHTEVLTGTPALVILSYAQSHQADLIVLCSHGYTGLKRWALGSVAQKITRNSSVPVLVLRTDRSDISLQHAEGARSVRALVALDGSALAEATMVPTAYLVAALTTALQHGLLHLIRVIKPTSEREERKYQAYDINIREYYRREAETYLSTASDTLSRELPEELGVQITSSVVEAEDVAETLIHIAETGEDTGSSQVKGYDLLAIATHGRSGIQRWLVGSIAERVLDGSRLPLLIVRPPQVISTSSPEDEATYQRVSP